MPDSVPVLKGFPSTAALQRLLEAMDLSGASAAIAEPCGIDSAPESMVPLLEEVGIHARVAFLHADEIRFLKLPTLLQLADGSWILLKKWEFRRLLADTLEGSRVLASGDLSRELPARALDLSPALPQGKTLGNHSRSLLREHRRILVQLALAALLYQALVVAMPQLTGVVMNRALPDGARSLLRLAAIGVLLVAVFQAWTRWIRERILLALVTRVAVSVERGLMEHLLRLPFPFLQRKSLGELLQAFGGLAAARELLAEKGLAALLDGVLGVSCLVVMGMVLPVLTLLVALAAAGMVAVAVLSGRAQVRSQALEVAARARERGYLTELIGGVGAVKAAGAEKHGIHHWLDCFQEELYFNLQGARRGLWSEVGASALYQAMMVTLLVWGGWLAMREELRLGTLFAFIQLTSGFLEAVLGLANTCLALAVLRPQLATTQELLATESEKRPSPATSRFQEGPLVMEDVWFRYTPQGPWVLKGYQLHLDPGMKFTLTGPSGCGKSTILRLLAGLYPPERGSIRIGGLSPQALRHQILYLPQFVQLYGGSIIENLRMLSGGAPLERLLKASQQTGLHELVANWPMGYQTLLPHGARNLSGGQRQLIALTAVVAAERSLVLLDEATANLDSVRSASLVGILHARPWTLVEAAHDMVD